jgi:hypothetical protein
MADSGARGKLIHEKNQKQKILWHCPFKQKNTFFFYKHVLDLQFAIINGSDSQVVKFYCTLVRILFACFHGRKLYWVFTICWGQPGGGECLAPEGGLILPKKSNFLCPDAFGSPFPVCALRWLSLYICLILDFSLILMTPRWSMIMPKQWSHLKATWFDA